MTRPLSHRPKRFMKHRLERDCTSLRPVQTDSTCSDNSVARTSGASASVRPLSQLTRRRDLKFSGFVTWTGSSSMEVVIKLQGAEPGTTSKTGSASSGADRQWETLMLGRFAMVCRDSKTHKARKVPPLVVETDEERVLRDIAAEHQQRRKERGLVALDKVPVRQAMDSKRSADLPSRARTRQRNYTA